MRISHFLLCCLVSAAVSSGLFAQSKPVSKIVFLTGDEAYRSEESMPMLAQILQPDFNFEVSVGFSVDEHGLVDPNVVTSLTETEELADADLMVIFLRFRKPDEPTFQRILDFNAGGKPVVAFRTSTHAFRFDADSPWGDWGRERNLQSRNDFTGGERTSTLIG
jgi:nucleoside 2-deoxyribosyltransferase